MVENELIPGLFKTEYSKIIAVLCSLFGPEHLQTAEDITHDTFLTASQTWSFKGVPENPTAWLYTVAKNKTRDHLRRSSLFAKKISPELQRSAALIEETDIDLSTENISDSQLKMMFVVCNPGIPVESQVALALRVLCGFGIDEIAQAFITSKETINKRLLRAKEKLRTSRMSIELPEQEEIGSRLDNVLIVLYLLYNEGYYSTSQDMGIRRELCLEAMKLNYLLLENEMTNTGAVNALLSLMCFHASRFDARMTETGEAILYDDQDRDLWNDGLIEKGNEFLIRSAKGEEITKYHLEASIAYWHCTKIEHNDKWENILQLYNKLLLIEYSPMTALNRTYALSKANGKLAAIEDAEQLNLPNHHLYHCMLGELYSDIDNAKALAHFERGLELAKTNSEKGSIGVKILKLIGKREG